MSQTFSFRRSASMLAIAAVLLSGCAAGPDFNAPKAPDVAAFDSEATPAVTSDGTQQLRLGATIPAQWWGLFHSQPLNGLIEQSLRDNPDLAAADASLRAAEASLAAETASFFPSIGANFSSARKQDSSLTTGTKNSIYTVHNASVSASYNPDVFGGTRRGVERLQAVADAARYQKEAAHLALTGNVVTAAIQEASLREQVAAATTIIAKREKLVAQLKSRFDVGAVPLSDLIDQQALLATSKASLPALQHQLSVQRHALSALAGQLPQHAPAAVFKLADLTLPAKLPLSLPSQLVAQRPDVRIAEENMHAASAEIGVARAARLPQFTLNADIGSMALKLGELFSPGGGFWSLGASAAQTIFDAGALANREEAAIAGFDQAAANYRSAVLAAFQNVADALHALQSDSDVLMATLDSRKAAADTLALTKARFNAGAISANDVLNAEIADLSAQADLTKARATRYADTAALLVALGGGWWNRDADTGLIIGSDVSVPSDFVKKGAL